MTILKDLIKINKKVYVHEEIIIGWFRLSYYRYGKKLTIRFEISKGWNK
jgi:hypothetical protein